MTKEYKLEVKVKNNLILEKLKEKGITSFSELERQSGIRKEALSYLVNMKKSPIHKITGDWNLTVNKLCSFLNCSPEDLFTDGQKFCQGISKKEYYASEVEIKYYLERIEQNVPLLEERYDQNLLENKFIPEALETLTPREGKIIEMRFGITNGTEHTLKECGNLFNISASRARQIERKALRKLRHPSRSEKLESFLD